MGLVMCCYLGNKDVRLSLLDSRTPESRSNRKFSYEKDAEFSTSKDIVISRGSYSLIKKPRKFKSSSSRKSYPTPRVFYRESTGSSNREKLLTDDFYGRRFSSPTSSFRSYSVIPMTKVHSNLYIGNWENANDESELKSKGITHILSLFSHQSSVEWVARKQRVMHDKGHSNIEKILDEVSEFMEAGQKGNNKLLVHCQLGQNRSAVVIIGFLMRKEKKTLHRAHRDLRKLRPIIQVNVDYAKQLLELELKLFGENTIPLNWMEREYDEAANDVFYKHDNLTTIHQRTIFAKNEENQTSQSWFQKGILP